MESGLVSGPALATAYAVGIQDNVSYGGDSCYLFETHQFKTIGEVLRYGDLGTAYLGTAFRKKLGI
jgi:hypothetical protein